MNEQDVVNHMIHFIEEKERQIQNSKFLSTAQNKNDTVKSILDELERVTTDENK